MAFRCDGKGVGIGRRLLVAGGMLALTGARAIEVDPHSRHAKIAPAVRRTVVRYQVPDIRLVRDDGRSVRLPEEIEDGRPVVLAFIYTSCTTICPVTSQTMSEVQARLGPTRDKVHLMSVSIDPEHDTPARLREYARRFAAGPDWQHYTGTLAASQTAQIAFGVYRGEKMNHAPAILVRPLPAAGWVRIDGFATAEGVLAELPEYCTQKTASR